MWIFPTSACECAFGTRISHNWKKLELGEIIVYIHTIYKCREKEKKMEKAINDWKRMRGEKNEEWFEKQSM